MSGRRSTSHFGGVAVGVGLEDEALVEAVVDLSGRPHLSWNARLPSGKRFIGTYDVDLTQDFFQALQAHARRLKKHTGLFVLPAREPGHEAKLNAPLR